MSKSFVLESICYSFKLGPKNWGTFFLSNFQRAKLWILHHHYIWVLYGDTTLILVDKLPSFIKVQWLIYHGSVNYFVTIIVAVMLDLVIVRYCLKLNWSVAFSFCFNGLTIETFISKCRCKVQCWIALLYR